MRRLVTLLFLILMLAGCNSGGGDTRPPENPPVVAESPCDPLTGLREPLPACSPDTVCTRVAPEVGLSQIDSPVVVPECDAAVWDDRWTKDVLGFTRYACIHRPPGISAGSPRPLVVWFHPGGTGGADLAGSETSLIAKADSFDLSGDSSRPGFILAAVQGRNLHFPTNAYRDGLHHDFYFRDLASPSTNPDIANADALIDDLVASGSVDLNRIYVMGWSNGGFFSQLYAIARHGTATPGGHRVASAAVFAAANPFENIEWDSFQEAALPADQSCAISIPASNVPIFIVHRTADAAVACDTVQAACFATEPGYITTQWLADSVAAGLNITGLMIGGLESGSVVGLDQAAVTCTDFSSGCTTTECTWPPTDGCLSLVNHERWPDGDYNNYPTTGVDRETDMFDFLKDHPNT
ncbi:MAG: hypothetical protein M0036_05960 [Desulfobacteraceae bacterium]|nr:hypothetical protein [Desulfobacteraceae bacterium]